MPLDTPFAGYVPSSVEARISALEGAFGTTTITRSAESDGWFGSA